MMFDAFMIIMTVKYLRSSTLASIKKHNISTRPYMHLKYPGGLLKKKKKIQDKWMKTFHFHLSMSFMACVQFKSMTSYINFK